MAGKRIDSTIEVRACQAIAPVLKATIERTPEFSSCCLDEKITIAWLVHDKEQDKVVVDVKVAVHWSDDEWAEFGELVGGAWIDKFKFPDLDYYQEPEPEPSFPKIPNKWPWITDPPAPGTMAMDFSKIEKETWAKLDAAIGKAADGSLAGALSGAFGLGFNEKYLSIPRGMSLSSLALTSMVDRAPPYYNMDDPVPNDLVLVERILRHHFRNSNLKVSINDAMRSIEVTMPNKQTVNIDPRRWSSLRKIRELIYLLDGHYMDQERNISKASLINLDAPIPKELLEVERALCYAFQVPSALVNMNEGRRCWEVLIPGHPTISMNLTTWSHLRTTRELVNLLRSNFEDSKIPNPKETKDLS